MFQQYETERVLERLALIPGLKRVTRGWPSIQASECLPCAVVHKSGERGAGWRDDTEYMTRTEYTVRVFAELPEQADEFAARASLAMEELGYRRALSWEESDGKVHQRLFRYERYI